MKKILIILLLLLSSCSSNITLEKPKDINIRKIDNLSDDFIMAVDISELISLEKSGVIYYDFEHNKTDILKLLKSVGISHIRVRIWNDPYDENHNGYGGGNCDLNNALEIAKRAKKYGLKMILDFHYSDFWADPSKQRSPKDWKELNIKDKEEALYQFTKDSLKQFKNNNIDVSIIQIGNEINNGLSSETDFNNISKLIKQGIKASKEIYPDVLICMHYTNPEKTNIFLNFAKQLHDKQVDYDILGVSYYPFWHGTLENLEYVLKEIKTKYDKQVLILETSYPYTLKNTDFHSNTISSNSNLKYPISIQGQTDFILDLIETVNKVNGLGICYWAAEWISVGTNSKKENEILWEKYGSGWATSYASEYDKDAKKYHGGSAVENQALFDENGYPLESLKVFYFCK